MEHEVNDFLGLQITDHGSLVTDHCINGYGMRILFIGDIVGKPGRRAIDRVLAEVVAENQVEFTIANGENAAGGMGITPDIALEMLGKGVDVLTSGNHIWAKREILPFLKEESRLLRPANYPADVPGRGMGVFQAANGQRVGVLNLEGRVFMKSLECPFRVGEKCIEKLKEQTKIVIVDFHAEATSEKMALGWFLNGKASAVLGTHTHIQTSDDRVLSEGTAYITDAGMTGPMDSVIGIRKEVALGRFLTQIPWRFDVGTDEIALQGVVLDIDEGTGRSQNIQRIRVPLEDRN
jgi:metallophosphoesterase (TIGR00282 family)